MLAVLARFLPGRKDYNFGYFKEDLLAGLTVAVVALPLALAFGVSSGAGAAAGLYTAIVAGVLAAAFGGSNLQVSGPTGAMTVVLLPIVARYGAGTLLFVGALAGLILIAFAFSGVGRYVNYIPWPVVAGFTSGIAVIIFLQQLPGVLGVASAHGESIVPLALEAVRGYAVAPTLPPLLLGSMTVVLMLLWGRVRALRAVPASMAALLAVTLLSLLPAFGNVPRIGSIPVGLPLPSIPAIPAADMGELLRAALAVAVLAALESLLSAMVADGMTQGPRSDPNRELFGQGIANLGAAVFGGVPATAALARTAVNVRSGARTRLAAMIHGFTLLIIVLFLGSLAGAVPLAVLAGILMVVAVRMVEPHALRLILRASKADGFVLLLTFAVTIAFDLILAIEIGLVAAGILFIVRVSRLFSVQVQAEEPLVADDRAQPLPREVVTYRIDGPVFFGAANRFLDQLTKSVGDIRFVVLRMRRVPLMDVTGASALEALSEHLSRRRIVLLVAGLQPQPEQLLRRSGLLARLAAAGHHLFPTTDEAIAYARRQLEDADDRQEQSRRVNAAVTSGD
ncbi:MAG TPA: SulP family inorganic anion transporter [Trueperaceae bacterium]